MMRSVLCQVVLLFSTTLLVASQTFTVADSRLVLQRGQDQIEVFIAIEPIDDLSKAGELKLRLSDVSTASGRVLSLEGTPQYVGGSGKKGYWRTVWGIPGPGLGFGETHLILISADSFSGIVPITIQPSSDPQVSLSGLMVIRLLSVRDGQLRITTTSPLSDVKPIQSSLVNDSGQELPATMLQVSNKRDGRPGGEVTNRSETVYLSIDPGFTTAGKFSGIVSLTSLQKPDLGSFNLTVYSTSRCYQLSGFGLLAIGLMSYFGIAIWAKGNSRKLAALLPAARLRDQAIHLVAVLENAQAVSGYNFTTLLGPVGNPGSLLDIVDQLSEQKLKDNGYVSFGIANPFGTQDIPGTYQTLLVAAANRMSVSTLIVQWGVTEVIAMWSQVQKAGVETAGKNALGALDNLAVQSGPPNLIQTQIQSIINVLKAAISAAPAGGGGAITVGGYGISGSHEIMVAQERLSIFVWIVWGILTLVVGSCALIWFNDGFGTGQDLAKCFLWGIGMPARSGRLRSDYQWAQ